jgi:hypothetical protein
MPEGDIMNKHMLILLAVLMIFTGTALLLHAVSNPTEPSKSKSFDFSLKAKGEW